jgi:hypothetical protein
MASPRLSETRDGRAQLRMREPQRRGKRSVTLHLDPQETRLLYDRAVAAGTSVQQIIRGLIAASAEVSDG